MFCANLPAQYYEDDARLWMNLNLSKRYDNGFEWQVTVQNRLNNNMSQYNGYVSPLLGYRVGKHVRVLAGLTAGGKRELNGDYSLVRQLFGGFILRQKTGKFTFSYRNLTQAQANGTGPFGERVVPATLNRNKLQVRFGLNKHIELFVSEELYVTLTNTYKYDEIGRSRTIAGAEYKLSKKSSIELFYLFQRQYDFKNVASRYFIYGITFNHAF